MRLVVTSWIVTCVALATAGVAPAADAPAGPDVFVGAEWLRDPFFEGVKVIDLFHRDKEKGPDLFGPRNVHTLMRHEVTLREKPASAVLAITGDDYYKFYINGYAVVQGPESGYPFSYPYYWLDVTEFLEPGVNCLAAHVYYQGLLNRVWCSADNRSGFMVALDVTYADGSRERIVTDANWKCLTLDAFPTGEPVGYKTQFPEDMDMRKMPVGWRFHGFNDSAWAVPLMGRQDHVFTLQLTPPLRPFRMDPIKTEKRGKGRWFYDFGREIAGCTRIKIKGDAGAAITVHHAEELNLDGSPRFDMRCNVRYEEKPILSGGDDVIEFYDYRAFRYIELLDAPGTPEVWVDVRRHDFDAKAAAFTSSDATLAQVWDICRNAVEMNSQGGYLDCPTREKGPYLGDAAITGRSQMWLTGDASLMRKTLSDFRDSAKIHPGLMAVAPGSFMQEIAEYSLQYTLLLREYWRYTGDTAFVTKMMDDVFDGLYGWFAKYEDAMGLLENPEGKWVLVDWPKNLRDDYDYDYAEKRANTVLNAFYYGSLTTAAELLRAVGRDGDAYETKAKRIGQAFASALADPKTGLYVDAPGSAHSSLHANAIPLAFGLDAGANRAEMLKLIDQRGLNCGVYIASYVIEGCFKAGAGDLAYKLLTNDSEHSWREMLRHGATTCMEAWGPDQKNNTSWCHAWASCPIYLLAEYVMGLSPGEPGWKRIRVSPAKIAGLPEMTLRIPHPLGGITARYTPGKGYLITAPEGVPVDVQAPEGVIVSVTHSVSQRKPELDETARAHLAAQGWNERVTTGAGIWVDVKHQRLYLFENGAPVWQAACSTALAGTGSEANSNKTPLGWHHVDEMIGDGAKWGQVFRSRKMSKDIWKPGDTVVEDMVLTRVFMLDGDEPGKNKGADARGKLVDSKQRYIYIHGTNGEDKIGTPASHGCVRLLNDDAIELYSRVKVGTPVLISEPVE